MPRRIEENIKKRVSIIRHKYRLWKENTRIRKFQPVTARAKVIILAFGPHKLRARGKVTVGTFFPPFCQVLAQRNISSVYVQDSEGLEREIVRSDEESVILINLVHEIHDNLNAYEITDCLSSKICGVFNSPRIAAIVGDKQKTNMFLSSNDVVVPSTQNLQGNRVFSNARIGSGEPVFVYENSSEMDKSRYNAQFIDTRMRFVKEEYYTSIRLMCIGPHLMQVFVRARDVTENDPSVHTKDTPINRALVDYLYGELVASRLDDFVLLANRLGSALGPGFYAHDVLLDNNTQELLVCETGFKFFDTTYWNRIRRIMDHREFQYNVMAENLYAEKAGHVFVSYCEEMSFL